MRECGWVDEWEGEREGERKGGGGERTLKGVWRGRVKEGNEIV